MGRRTQIEEYIGKRYNNCVILGEAVELKVYGAFTVRCKCDCGNEFEVRLNALKTGNTKGCGCQMNASATPRKSNARNLTGMVFGNLTAVSRYPTPKGKKTKWKCLCACGNTAIVQTYHLTNQHTQSCGCIRSAGERKLAEELRKNGIPFSVQTTFDGCKHSNPLRFDFFIPRAFALVEFQGRQHYEPIGFFGGEEALRNNQKRDKIKRDFCEREGIELIEIRYDALDEISTVLEKIKSNIVDSETAKLADLLD